MGKKMVRRASLVDTLRTIVILLIWLGAVLRVRIMLHFNAFRFHFGRIWSKYLGKVAVWVRWSIIMWSSGSQQNCCCCCCSCCCARSPSCSGLAVTRPLAAFGRRLINTWSPRVVRCLALLPPPPYRRLVHAPTHCFRLTRIVSNIRSLRHQLLSVT